MSEIVSEAHKASFLCGRLPKPPIERFVHRHRVVPQPGWRRQGGFLTAMLDDTLGPALVATVGEASGCPPLICRFSASDRRCLASFTVSGTWCGGDEILRFWRASCAARAGTS
jgi:hypothetical protein